VAEGLVRREEDAADRRRTVLSVTDKGMKTLEALSASHARELDEFGPGLIRALERIKAVRAEKAGGSTTALHTTSASASRQSAPAIQAPALRAHRARRPR